MAALMTRRLNAYALTFRLPIIVWQAVFFVGPLLFMIAMSFFLVKNYRMVEAFEFTNWEKMLSRNYVWDSYWFTLGLATLSSVTASLIAFPAAFALAYRSSEAVRRWASIFTDHSFFHQLSGADIFMVCDPR